MVRRRKGRTEDGDREKIKLKMKKRRHRHQQRQSRFFFMTRNLVIALCCTVFFFFFSRNNAVCYGSFVVSAAFTAATTATSSTSHNVRRLRRPAQLQPRSSLNLREGEDRTSAVTSSSAAAAATVATTKLRIIQINDVYKLDNFPHLKSLIEYYKSKESYNMDGDDGSNGSHDHDSRNFHCIVICCGDFLAPSLLSSLDKGYGMVDVLKHVGCNYVCIGNHENDVGNVALRSRILQSMSPNTISVDPKDDIDDDDDDGTEDDAKKMMKKKKRRRWFGRPRNGRSTLSSSSSTNNADSSGMVWINSNIPQLNQKLNVKTKEYVTIQLSDDIRVVLLGLLTDDPSLYRPGAFGDAHIEPIVETTTKLLDKLQHQQKGNNNKDDEKSTSTIIALTHQGIQEDRAMATKFGDDIAVLCGGHDHEPYLEHNDANGGCHIVKAGMDATHAAIIDLTWEKKTTAHSGSEKTASPAVTRRRRRRPQITTKLVD